MKRLWAAFVVSGLFQVFSGLAFADLPDASWKALGERAIVVVKKDGSELSGKIMAVDAAVVTLTTGDGQILAVARSDVRTVRLQPAAGASVPAVTAPPLALPPALGPPPAFPPPPMYGPAPALPPLPGPASGSVAPPLALLAPVDALTFLEVGALVNVVKATSPDALVALLDRDGRVPRLSAAQQERVSEEGGGLSTERRATGVVLNLMVLPGIGSLTQGDYWWAGALLIADAVGVALLVSSAGTGGTAAEGVAGFAIFVGSWLTGLIRAAAFEGPKPSMLREYFRRKAQASSGLELRPFAAVQPSMGAGASVTQLYQFGLQGRF